MRAWGESPRVKDLRLEMGAMAAAKAASEAQLRTMEVGGRLSGAGGRTEGGGRVSGAAERYPLSRRMSGRGLDAPGPAAEAPNRRRRSATWDGEESVGTSGAELFGRAVTATLPAPTAAPAAELNEEHARLREENAMLKERARATQRELEAARRELEDVRRDVDAARAELQDVRHEAASECTALGRCREQRFRLEEKLARSRSVVKTVVDSVDRLFAAREALEAKESAGFNTALEAEQLWDARGVVAAAGAQAEGAAVFLDEHRGDTGVLLPPARAGAVERHDAEADKENPQACALPKDILHLDAKDQRSRSAVPVATPLGAHRSILGERQLLR